MRARSPLLAALWLAVACGGTSAASGPPDAGPVADAGPGADAGSDAGPSGAFAPGKVTWLLNHEAYALIAQQDADGARLAPEYFANASTWYITTATADPSTFPANVRPAVSFTSLDGIRTALSKGLPAWVQAVIYDDENWSFTPAAEQQDPGSAYTQAGQLVHAAKLVFIAVPATNLVRAIEPNYTGSIDDEFVRLNIAGQVAASADVYEMQAQGIEADAQHFQQFVTQTATQARAANAHVQVLAGLSTNPTGHTVTSDELFADVQATFPSQVAGYWMNVPAASAYCPSCGTPQPQVAVGLLQSMERAP